MSDLTDPNPEWPDGWSIPAGVYNFETKEYHYPPVVWIEAHPATLADIRAVAATNTAQKRGIDGGSICGTADDAYTHWTAEYGSEPPYKQEVVAGG